MQKLAGLESLTRILQPKTKQSSPLISWIVMVFLGAICILAMLLVDPRPIEWNRKTVELSKRVQSTPAHRDSKSIVFLGNSLLQFSLPASEPRFASWIQSRFKIEDQPTAVQVLNLTFAGESAESISILADSVLTMRPAAVVMQIELLFTQTHVDTTSERLAVWAHFFQLPFDRYLPAEASVAKAGEKLFGKTPAITGGARTFHFGKQKRAVPIETRLKRQMWKAYDLSDEQPSFRMISQFARAAQQRGIRVIIIETPLSATAKAVAPGNLLQLRHKMAQKALGADSEFFLPFPEILQDEYFRDYRHVNARGQQKFLQWLVPALVRKLSKET